ncbi:cell wall protein RBR3-like [Cajanus cajan]|uniref:cell wall protein RBR3-like n=1 Tax=Cajanus cajan TaxID=3821 RepID=UPI00098DA9CF|nr:cell wall protein RBR3-like [Cajanus cajan]
MESIYMNGSNVDMRTGASTKTGGGEQFNIENKQVPSSSPFSSEDFFDFMPNETTTRTNARPLGATSPTHDQNFLQSEFHQTHSVANKGDGRPINSHSHVESDPANPFFELDPSPLANNIAPSSSSQNPFLMTTDANNTSHLLPAMHQESGGMANNGFPPSLGPSSFESSQGNPFKPPTTSTTKKTSVGAADLVKGGEHYDLGNESHHRLPPAGQDHWSMPSGEERTHPVNTYGETHVSSSSQQLDPFKFESPLNRKQADATSKNHAGATTIPTSVEQPHHTFSVREQGHHAKTSSNSGTDNRFGSSSVPSFPPAYESSTQDYMHNSASATTKRGKDSRSASESGDDDMPISSFPRHGQQASNGSEKQTPPLQVMERSEDTTKSSKYRFPSHVFSRKQSNTQWSTASNESLFSIQMGNTSFSSDLAWMSKSGDIDRPGDTNPSSVTPSNQPQIPLPLPPPPQAPSTKFNHISQSTANQHEGSKVTEEKAAETMREVIMENSINNENIRKGDSTTAGGPTRADRHAHVHSSSHRSDGSTKSFAFNVMTDGDKALSSKHSEDKRKQQKQPEQQNIKATPDVAAAQNPKPTPNASNQNKSWLSCFPCCG